MLSAGEDNILSPYKEDAQAEDVGWTELPAAARHGLIPGAGGQLSSGPAVRFLCGMSRNLQRCLWLVWRSQGSLPPGGGWGYCGRVGHRRVTLSHVSCTPSSNWTSGFPASSSPTTFIRRRAPQARQMAHSPHHLIQPTGLIQELIVPALPSRPPTAIDERSRRFRSVLGANEI